MTRFINQAEMYIEIVVPMAQHEPLTSLTSLSQDHTHALMQSNDVAIRRPIETSSTSTVSNNWGEERKPRVIQHPTTTNEKSREELNQEKEQAYHIKKAIWSSDHS